MCLVRIIYMCLKTWDSLFWISLKWFYYNKLEKQVTYIIIRDLNCPNTIHSVIFTYFLCIVRINTQRIKCVGIRLMVSDSVTNDRVHSNCCSHFLRSFFWTYIYWSQRLFHSMSGDFISNKVAVPDCLIYLTPYMCHLN